MKKKRNYKLCKDCPYRLGLVAAMRHEKQEAFSAGLRAAYAMIEAAQSARDELREPWQAMWVEPRIQEGAK